MRGGHNIKSVNELKKTNTFRPAYHANRLESVVKTEKTIIAPHDISDRALEKWNWVCKKISDNDMLVDADRDAIRIYCENWILYEDCLADVRENGTVLWVELSTGKKPMTNPAFKHMKECEVILKQLWDQFGFTPRARMGLKVSEEKTKKNDDPLDFLN